MQAVRPQTVRTANFYKELANYAKTQAKAYKNVNAAESQKYIDAANILEKKRELQELWEKTPKKMFF